jgi:hypothetical protein
MVPATARAAGGAGLYDHSALDPFPRSAGLVSGLVALALTVVVAATFWFLNSAFPENRAAGAPDQLGPIALASPSASVSASPSPAAGLSASPTAR